MADLYSVISSIQPTQQSVLEAEILVRQTLEAKYPDLDLREGTAIRDLVLRPSAFILALCKTGLDTYFSQNNISQLDDASPAELVDGLLSNLFLTRNTGTYAIINARLYFARAKSVTLNSTTSFSTDGTLLFMPAGSTTYSADAMQFDSFSNEYYIDVDLVAGDKGSNYNIGSGSLLYFSNFDPYFLRGEINYLASASTSPESNLEFIARAKSAISTRNLINSPSISSRLSSDLNYLNRIKTVGAGDEEIYRDQIKVLGGPGKSLSGTDMYLTDSNSNLQVVLPNFPWVVGQNVSIVESGSNPSKLVILRTPITSVVNSSNFKITLPVTVTPRSFAWPTVTPVEDEIFIHQGGVVDVYCGEVTSQTLSKLTLDSSGKCTVAGPNFNIVRSTVSDGEPDTLPTGAAFTKSVTGQVVETDVQFSQDGDGTITVHFKNHPFTRGRMIGITGWPTNGSSSYLVVHSVIDAHTFKVGRGLPVYTPGSGLNPSVTYMYPRQDKGFSVDQSVVFDFGPSRAGNTCTFRLSKFDHVPYVQSYLDLPENRVLCGDYLARGFDLYVLDFNLIVYDTAAPTSGYASTYINEFLRSLSPGQDFILSDLVAKLTSDAGISKLKTPLSVNYTFYTKDLFPGQTGTVTDVLVPETSTSIFILGNITTSTEYLA